MSTNAIKTVLFLPAWYPTRNDNMGGIFVRAFGLALLDKTNVHVLHIAAEKDLAKVFDYTRSIDDGLETHILYYRKPLSKNKFTFLLEGFLYGTAMILGYYHYRKQHKRPDIFHVFVLTRTAVLPYLLSLLKKTDYYITEVWSRYLPEDNTFNGTFRKWLTRNIVKKAKGVSTVSLSLKNALISHGLNNDNFQVIHSVVPAPFFATKLNSFPKQDVVKFLHVSCFDDYIKNISGMLNAFKLVEDEGLIFKLQLVGHGTDFQAMIDYANVLELKQVEFVGKLTGNDLFIAFEQANALVLFSNFETQGCVILEAQACGMPVIGSNTGGIPELITEDRGFLAPPGDEVLLAGAIRKMICDYQKFDSLKIREHAIANYSYGHIAEKFIRFYEKGIYQEKTEDFN